MSELSEQTNTKNTAWLRFMNKKSLILYQKFIILITCVFFFYYNLIFESLMEDRKEEIKQYLAQNVNPIIQPMLKKIAEQKPTDVLSWMNNYISTRIHQRQKGNHSSGSESEGEDQQFMKKLQQMKKKNKKKNSRQAISAECFGHFNKKSDYVPKVVPKSQQTKQVIRGLLKSTIVFKALESKDLNTVIDALEQFTIQGGQTVIKEGDQGDMLFIVCSGQYQCSKVIHGQEKYLKTYVSGQAFGQLALMYNSPRQATIRCTKPGTLYGLDRSTFTNIVQQAAQKKRKYVNECISNVGILSDIQPYERQRLCDALKAEQFEAGQYVVKQGESGDRFYLVAEGQLIAQKQETPNSPVKKVFDYKVGDYFGEIALIKNTVRQASIKTETKCKLMSIDRDSFKRLLGPIEDILMRNMQRYKKYMDQ